MQLVLGNRDARDGDTKMPKGKRATSVVFADDVSIADALTHVVSPQGLWAAHATEGATPAWVAGDHELLVALVADHFGGIEIRELES